MADLRLLVSGTTALLTVLSTNIAQVHGRHDEQRPQTCELRRILQVSPPMRSLHIPVAQTHSKRRGIQSAGAAVAWRLDGVKVAYMSLFISNWVLLAASLFIAAPVMLWKIKDTVSLEEDLKFSDETIEDVVSSQYQMRNVGQMQHRDLV